MTPKAWDLHVYAMGCTWHGHIGDVATIKTGPNRPGLPCCPFCRSMLMQAPEDEWWEGAKKREKTHPNYVEFLKWTQVQKRCWPSMKDAAAAFKQATGKDVPFE